MARGLERPDSGRPAMLPDFDGKRHLALNPATQDPLGGFGYDTVRQFRRDPLAVLDVGSLLAMHAPDFFYTLACDETLVAIERMQPVFQCRTLNPPT